ncbi:hypothetical protein DFH29DRAFT_871824 [Suillus ampliporus]|nr:hypothetical protein DFH29DRAFT_871824 [Suillus ampliporus]
MELPIAWLQQWLACDMLWPDLAGHVLALTKDQAHKLHSEEEACKRCLNGIEITELDNLGVTLSTMHSSFSGKKIWGLALEQISLSIMAPPSIYFAEQMVFIQLYQDKFLECKTNGDYKPFWNPFFEDWAAKFPERAVIFPDIPLDMELTEEQIMKGSKDKASCSLKDWEINKVRDSVKHEQDILKDDPDVKPVKKMNLSIIREQTKWAFTEESEDVKREVWAVVETMKEKKRAEIEEIKQKNTSLDNAA